jgi:hypothetical protein
MEMRCSRSRCAAFKYNCSYSSSFIIRHSNRQPLPHQHQECAYLFETAKLKRIFEELDEDGSGTIDDGELTAAMARLGYKNLPRHKCQELLAMVDSDGNGLVDFDEFERFFRFVPLANLGSMAEHLLLEAKKLGVHLRDAIKGHQPMTEAALEALASQSAEAAVRRDYYGDHSLMLLCESQHVSAALVRRFLEVPGAAKLAKVRRADTGLMPLDALCTNAAATPAAVAEAVGAFVECVPAAASWMGCWGSLPLHVICAREEEFVGGPWMRGVIKALLRAFPASAIAREKVDGACPFHVLCENVGVTADAVDAFLTESSGAGFVLDGHKETPLDLLARNEALHFGVIGVFLQVGTT